VIAAAALLALVLFLGAPAPASGQACTPVGYGNPPVGASISTPAEMDCFTVAAGAGDRLQLTIAETSAGFTAFSDIRRPDGSTLCASAASPQVCVVDSAGTHTVLVRDVNGTGTGSYALSVQRLNSPVGCTPLAYGGAPVAGATAAAADVDCFSFAGAAGERAQVTIGRVSGGLTPFTTIVRPDGTPVCSGTASPQICFLDTAGPHAVIFRDANGVATGQYALSLQRLNPPVGCTPLALGGSPVSASIAASAELHCYTVPGAAGDRVQVTSGEVSGALEVIATIARPDGTTLCASVNTPMLCVLDAAGPHTILVRDSAGVATGQYGLSAQRLNAPLGCAPLASGAAPLAATIAAAAEVDCYTFAGATGGRIQVTVRAASGAFATFTALVRPDGTTLCSDLATPDTCDLDADGTHAILVRATNSTATGQYTVAMTCLSGCVAPPHTLTITSGPGGSPNPVASAGAAALTVAAVDSHGHALGHLWTASCPALGGPGSFSSATAPGPTWTAPANLTGAEQTCTIQVTVSDGQGLAQAASYAQRVSPAPTTGFTCPAGPGPSLVEVAGRQLVVRRRQPDGSLGAPAPYRILGVNWAPACRGSGDADRQAQFGVWKDVDIPLIQELGANTVRVHLDFGASTAGCAVLDALHAHGLMAVVTVDRMVADLPNAAAVVVAYRRHPAVLMWSLGNEWNVNRYFGAFATIDDAARATETAAALIQTLDADHPVASSLGDIDIPGLTPLAKTAEIVSTLAPSVDVWGLNVSRGASFGTLFAQWVSISAKPMFLGEFGTDAFDQRAGHEDQALQAAFDIGLWDEIAARLSADDPARVVLGGFVFELGDEWWKAGNPSAHDTGGFAFAAHPDGFANEEWFGLVDIDRQKRQAYVAFQSRFADPLTSFVAGFYRTVLAREPEPAGLAGWVGFLGGSCNAAGFDMIARAFFDSLEFRTIRPLTLDGLVAVLYRTFLHRQPDAPGAAGWVGLLRSARLAVALGGFIPSAEFQALVPNRADPAAVRSVVERLYQQILERTASPAEVQGWVDFVVATGRLEDTAVVFLASPEFESRPLTFRDYVRILYRTFLGREPDAPGLDGWESVLRASLLDVINAGFVPSAEFQSQIPELCS
jgi:hypothetical protein